MPPFLKCYSEALFRQMFFDIMKGHNSLAMFFSQTWREFQIEVLKYSQTIFGLFLKTDIKQKNISELVDLKIRVQTFLLGVL